MAEKSCLKIAALTLVLVMVLVVIIVPITTDPNTMPHAPAMFEHNGFVNVTFKRYCPCAPAPYGTPYNGEPDATSSTNPRQISNAVFDQTTSSPSPLSAMWWLMGQFVDHEITGSDESDVELHINIAGDPTFGSVPHLTSKRVNVLIDEEQCRLPINRHTPFIDASNVYSYDIQKLPLLRFEEGGLLKTSEGNMLPFKDLENPTAFSCGDERCMEHAGLTAMHTIWMREHNHWAKVISSAKRSWSNDQVYWKARQVVIAEMQKVIYEEWLPALLGSMTYLLGTPEYDPELTPDIHTEFAVAAFRTGHSMVNNHIETDAGPISLIQLFTQSMAMHSPISTLGELLKGFSTTPAEVMDAKVVSGLRNFLFGSLGLDLVTMNIVRGREVGIARYGEILRCIMGRTGPETSSNLDALHGMLQEDLVEGSNTGATAGTIVAQQFKRLRDSDPNFYLWESQKEAIGSILYNQIERVTMKDILVRNTNLKHGDLNENVFLVYFFVVCSSIDLPIAPSLVYMPLMLFGRRRSMYFGMFFCAMVVSSSISSVYQCQFSSSFLRAVRFRSRFTASNDISRCACPEKNGEILSAHLHPELECLACRF